MALIEKVLLFLNRKFLKSEDADFTIENIQTLKFKIKEKELDLKVFENVLTQREIAILKREEALILAEIELDFKTSDLEAQTEALEKNKQSIDESIKLNDLIYRQLALEHSTTSGSNN